MDFASILHELGRESNDAGDKWVQKSIAVLRRFSDGIAAESSIALVLFTWADSVNRNDELVSSKNMYCTWND